MVGDLTFGIVTDLHFGPEARWQGKLRKLSHKAGDLARDVVRRMNDEVRPDFVVNLGDDIEDQSRAADLEHYAECQAILSGLRAPLVNVAGNHDLVHMNRADLNRFWQRSGPLYYSFDRAGWHFVVMHTIERRGIDVQVPEPQLDWVSEDLTSTPPAAPTVVFMHHSASDQDVEDSRWWPGRPHLALVRQRAKLRAIFERSGRVRAVFNGHLHWNHLDVISSIAYVTVQSLVENLDEDAPGRPAAAYAVVRLDARGMRVRVHGSEPARYQIAW